MSAEWGGKALRNLRKAQREKKTGRLWRETALALGASEELERLARSVPNWARGKSGGRLIFAWARANGPERGLALWLKSGGSWGLDESKRSALSAAIALGGDRAALALIRAGHPLRFKDSVLENAGFNELDLALRCHRRETVLELLRLGLVPSASGAKARGIWSLKKSERLALGLGDALPEGKSLIEKGALAKALKKAPSGAKSSCRL